MQGSFTGVRNKDLKSGKIWDLYEDRGTLYLLGCMVSCLRFSSHVSQESRLTPSTMTSGRHFLATESLTHLSVQAAAGSETETPPEVSGVCLLHVVRAFMCVCMSYSKYLL